MISDDLHVSQCHLSSLFKKITDENLNEYITDVRLKHAKELLRNTTLKIYEIADKVGYSVDSQYFSTSFKSKTGMSPSEYRNNII